MAKRLSSLSFLLLIFSFSFVLSTGCGFNAERREAEAFIDSYFDTIDSKKFNSLLSLYSDRAFGVVTSEKALRAMEKTLIAFGPLQSYEFNPESIIIKENTYGEISVKLSYNARYKEMKTKENFTISKDSGESRWLIIKHLITRENEPQHPFF